MLTVKTLRFYEKEGILQPVNNPIKIAIAETTQGKAV